MVEKIQEGSQVFVMKNNRVRLVKSDGGNLRVVKSRNRLIRLYNALRQKGGWRAVQAERGAKNVAIVYNFAMHGQEPKCIEDRKACFLYKERKPRKAPSFLSERIKLMASRTRTAIMTKAELKREEKEIADVIRWLE